MMGGHSDKNSSVESANMIVTETSNLAEHGDLQEAAPVSLGWLWETYGVHSDNSVFMICFMLSGSII